MRLAELCGEPTSTAQGVALEAARDESFSALLLKLANSASSARASRVADLTTAVARLGFRLVQGLALAAPGLRLLAGPRDGLEEQRREIHRHAVRTALAARMLAPAGVDAERALTAGLVHNVGLNVVALYEPHAFRALLDGAAAERPFREVEHDVLGFTHAELGGLIAERWSYPPELIEVIRGHDDPEPDTQLAAVLRLADLLVRWMGVGVEPIEEPSFETLGLVGIDLDTARRLLQPVLEAQDRLDARMGDDGALVPDTPESTFLSAFDNAG
jgi:HD-like signal output (HDOD) protein